MLKRTGLIGGAAILLTLVFGGSAAYGQPAGPALGAGPLLVASNGNPLREVSCDVYVGGGSSQTFTVAITASPPALGGASSKIAQQTFFNVPAGQSRTLMTSAPMVPNLGPIFCIAEPQNIQSGPQRLFSTLSSINLYDDSIETVVGASGNTSIPN